MTRSGPLSAQLREGREEEAGSLSRIARRSKAGWGYPRRWLRRWRGDLTLTAPYVRQARVFCALCPSGGGRRRGVVGFCAAADRGAGMWELDHLWVLPAWQGRGIGGQLFRRALAEVRSAGGRCLRVVSDPNAEGFYRRQGARRAYSVPSWPPGRELPALFAVVETTPGGGEQVEIREAGELRPGDVGRIVELHGVLYAQEWGFDSTFESYVAEPLARFVRTRSARERLWLVEEGASLRGCLAIVRVSEEEAQLRWFLLHPALRGQGMGKRLLAEAIDFCRRCGYRRIVLWTVSQLRPAAHLYCAAGFRLVEEKASTLWGQTLNEQRYLLELC